MEIDFSRFRFENSSVRRGEHPVLTAPDNIGLFDTDGLNLQVQEITTYYDEWKGSSGATLENQIANTLRYRIPFNDFPAGLYSLTFGLVRGERTIESKTRYLFEVYEDSTQISHSVENRYDSILANRLAMKSLGLGDSTANKAFQALILVKNNDTTRPIDFYSSVLVPLGRLGIADVTSKVLEAAAAHGMQYDHADIRNIIQRQSVEPTAVIAIPKIMANTIEEVREIATSEAEAILGLFSIHRRSYGEMLAIICADPNTSQSQIFLHTPYFAVNYAGGFISGEHRPQLMSHLQIIKNNPLIALYVSLLRAARQDRNIEHRYFKLWSLLETIARAKNYVGQPKKNWLGTPSLNRRGQVIMIQDQVKELVYELFREHFSAHGTSDFMKNWNATDKGELNELLTVWYRHRNCSGHRGGCFSNDPHFCDQSSSDYVFCRDRHLETVGKYSNRSLLNDDYLKTLDNACEAIIGAEIRLLGGL